MRQSNSDPTNPDIPEQDSAGAIAQPFHLSRVEGVTVSLRLIQPDDAEYVHSLRTDIDYNRHLSKITGDAGAQRAWIEAYKTRESALQELYYVIERCDDGERCGLVRLYEITQNCFTWGSWILAANKPRKAALESALLSFSVGFDRLALPKALVDVRKENINAQMFYQRLGMTEIKRDEVDIYFFYDRDRFEADRDTLSEIVQKEA